MLLHRAVAAFGAGSSASALIKFEPEKQQGAAGDEGESDGAPRDNDGVVGAAKSDGMWSWMSSYVDQGIGGDHVGRHSSMKMDCGWYGHDGAFGADCADGTSAPAPLTDSSLASPELWKPIPLAPDCPICLVPMPLDGGMVTYYSCCGKVVCHACYKEHKRSIAIINSTRKTTLPPVQVSCLFCRSSLENFTYAAHIDDYKAQARRGDGRAAWNLAAFYENGENGLVKDEARALQLYHTSANLGFVDAMGELGYLYSFEYGGKGLKDFGRMFLEAAASKGNVYAHRDLADIEFNNGNSGDAMKHLKIAASAGHAPSMKRLWTMFQKKELSKVDLEETLRAHKAACDQMSSIERERILAYEAAKKSEDELLIEHYQSYYDGKISAKVLKRVVKSHQGLGLKK